MVQNAVRTHSHHTDLGDPYPLLAAGCRAWGYILPASVRACVRVWVRSDIRIILVPCVRCMRTCV